MQASTLKAFLDSITTHQPDTLYVLRESESALRVALDVVTGLTTLVVGLIAWLEYRRAEREEA